MKTLPPAAGLVFFLLFSAMFLFGGVSVLYRQKTGKPTEATVTSCTGGRRSQVCRGTWMVDGKFQMGTIENANTGDQGKRIEVRVSGDRAYKPGLRLPIILFSLGLGIAGLTAYWWFKEVPKSPSKATTPDAYS